MGERYSWVFPVARVHAGILMGNARMGVMVWGSGNTLRLTLGRADLWDHRGGKSWTSEMTYPRIRALLEAKDEEGLRRIFEGGPPPTGAPKNPSIMPVGRFELSFPDHTELTAGTLDVDTGEVLITLRRGGARLKVKLTLSMDADLLHVELPRETAVRIASVPAWQGSKPYLESISFTPPRLMDDKPAKTVGWVQEMPADPPAVALCRREGDGLWITVRHSVAAIANPVQAAAKLLEQAIADGAETLHHQSTQWWKSYWKTVPQIEIPNERLSFIYRYGMYKFAGLTSPRGVAATLQGPWIEDYQVPPWGSDYHFNINVQMCYWPAYQGNKLEHLKPLFEMVWGWRDKLRENARLFAGVEDGLMLPHSVDDRCDTIGGFWSGTVDHACTAWVAKMMFDFWLYGGDDADNTFLRERAMPFMKGAMRVYEAMLEKEKEGEGYVLPVSVSPEYRAAQMNAWGRNASFQVGCIHWLIESLLHAANVLKQTPEPQWLEIQRGLPKACVGKVNGREMIMLWEGTPLEESHRHHSHWAGLYPWDVIDLEDARWKEIVRNTYDWWNRQGMGLWSGWCVPWAAMLHTRVGSAEMTEALLEYWERVFTNEGHGTLHDSNIFKRTLEAPRKRPPEVPFAGKWGHGEIMQIEAGMAATAAILDSLVQVRRGVHHLFAGAPAWWRRSAFQKIRTEGGFLVSASLRDGVARAAEIEATRAGVFRLKWPGQARIIRGNQSIQLASDKIEITMEAGERVAITHPSHDGDSADD